MLVLLDSCFGFSLRNGAFFVSFLCFVFGVLNLVAVFVTIETDSTRGVGRYIHLGIFAVFLIASVLLAAAVVWENYRAVLVWLAFYTAVTLLALVGHDLAKFNHFIVDADSLGGIIVGIGIFNIVVDIIFLMVVFSYYRQCSFKKVEEPRPSRPVTTL
ncbi:uncharacterized protein [Anabrus simplex]|uniref:uncharacterized protein n=1 Tax=Anabrus simplex TaxID=316456 RepID=UPI0034DDA213